MSRSFKDKNRRQKDNRQKARSDVKRRKERSFKRDLAPGSSPKSDAPKISHAQLKSLEKLLGGIGTPEPKPLVPDAFQIEALKERRYRLNSHFNSLEVIRVSMLKPV